MNTLVHIIRFYARESVAHAQKEHKVKPRFKLLNSENQNWGVLLGLMPNSHNLKLVCIL